MERKVKLLAALLGLQVAVALAFILGGNQFSPAASTAPLLDFDKAVIDDVRLWGPDGEELRLSKTEEGWRLPALDGFPADGPRIEQLLDKLHALESGPAVASSRQAQKRFKVSEQAFERKLTLAANGKEVATLYLGTTPGLRRIHARLAGVDAIHQVELAAFDVPLERESWQDNSVLQFPSNEVAALTLNDLKLQRSDESEDEWIASSGLAADEDVDSNAVNELARLLANLRTGRILDADSKAIAALEEPLLEVALTRSNGDIINYQLAQSAEDEQYVLKSSARPEYFHLPSFRAQALLEGSSRDALVQRVSPPEEDTALQSESDA